MLNKVRTPVTGPYAADAIVDVRVPVMADVGAREDEEYVARVVARIVEPKTDYRCLTVLLIDRLKNDEVMEVKMATVVALGQYGPDAREAVMYLRELAGKFDPKKSKEAQTIQETLKLIGAAKKKG